MQYQNKAKPQIQSFKTKNNYPPIHPSSYTILQVWQESAGAYPSTHGEKARNTAWTAPQCFTVTLTARGQFKLSSQSNHACTVGGNLEKAWADTQCDWDSNHSPFRLRWQCYPLTPMFLKNTHPDHIHHLKYQIYQIGTESVFHAQIVSPSLSSYKIHSAQWSYFPSGTHIPIMRTSWARIFAPPFFLRLRLP